MQPDKRLEVALLLESQEGLTWSQLFEVARNAERLGFSALYLSDHLAPVDLSTDREVLPALSALSALAMATTSINIGTLVSPITIRHPVELAKTFSSLEHLAGPRVDLGIGAGWHGGEHEMFGIDFPEPKARAAKLAASLEVITQLWSGETCNRSGEYFPLRSAKLNPVPVSKRAPLILGGAGPKLLGLAAKYAIEWNCFYKSIDEFGSLSSQVSNACMSLGRNPEDLKRSLMTPLMIGNSEAEVISRIDLNHAVFPGLPADSSSWQASGMVGGSVDQVRSQISKLRNFGLDKIIFEHLNVDDVDVLELTAEALISQ